MADKRTPIRGHTRMYRTGAGTVEAHVEAPRVAGRRQPPIVETFRTVREADKWQTRTKEQVRGRTYVDRKTSPTVAEQMRVWQAEQTAHHAPGTAKNVRLTIKAVDTDPLGAMLLVDVGRADLQAFVDELRTRLAYGTVCIRTTWLRAMLIDATRKDPPQRPQPLIHTSPWQGVKISKRVGKGGAAKVVRADRILSPDQVRQLADAMPQPWQRTMLLCHAGSGMRLSELLGWREQDIDFDRCELHLDTQLNPMVHERTDLKTEKSVRVVPLPDWVIAELRKHMDKYPPLDGRTLTRPRPYSRRFPAKTEAGLLFYDPITLEPAWTTYDRPLVHAAKLLHAADPSFPEVSSHDLRHHYVSLLIHRGHSAVAVGALIGDTPEQVWRTYSHVWPGSADDTRRALDEAYGAPKPPLSLVPAPADAPAVAFRLPSERQTGL